MIRIPQVHLKKILCVAGVSAVFGISPAVASVETYVDQVLPTPDLGAQGQPMSAGSLTMQDVLKSFGSGNKKAQPNPALIVAPSSAASLPSRTAVGPAPVAAAPDASKASLLEHGMRSIFGAPAVTAAPTQLVPQVAPKDISVSVLPPVTSPSAASAPAPVASPAPANTMNGGCMPQTSSWTKTCAEAGYPANYVGQIRGETRTTCPAGGLQDVWMANSCSPPESAPSPAPANLTAPSGRIETPAAPVGGVCGAASGIASATRPANDLCLRGTATAVTGHDVWQWNCQGSNGGATANCAAPLMAVPKPAQPKPLAAPLPVPAAPPPPPAAVAIPPKPAPMAPEAKPAFVPPQAPAPTPQASSAAGAADLCGSAAEMVAIEAPSKNLCKSGTAGHVTGRGPWNWTCSEGAQQSNCATLSLAPMGAIAPAPAASKSQTVSSAPLSGTVPPAKPNVPAAPKVGPMPDMTAPSAAPDLPDDDSHGGTTPPPVSNLIQPAPALRPEAETSAPPNKYFTLGADVSTVVFGHAASNLDDNATSVLAKLADVLHENGSVRVTLTAYADNAGTTPREARRLSLARALAIRDYLVSKDIASARIDVRALGANVPSGAPDRVDIKAN